MFKIKLNGINGQPGEEKTFASYNEAARMNGATSGMNKQACIKYLAKNGFDIATIIDEEGDTDTERKPQLHIVDRIIKMATTIDKDEIKRLQVLHDQMVSGFNVKGDVNAQLEKIEKLDSEIKLASNPQIGRDAVLVYFAKMYDDHMAEIAAAEKLAADTKAAEELAAAAVKQAAEDLAAAEKLAAAEELANDPEHATAEDLRLADKLNEVELAAAEKLAETPTTQPKTATPKKVKTV